MKLLILIILLTACGSDKPASLPPPSGGPVVQPPAGGPKLSYQDMQGRMNEYCKSCHASDSFIASEAGLRSSKAQLRLSNKTMPPNFATKALPDNVRTQMLSYF